ncbi:hypothetical protein ACFPK5_25160 [Streptomyces beijiangensis]|uniref:hypothetical protein n=1 Tax=Streptomyces beijiangensis TaxID=163361 RepID=UPI001F5C160D|nr:hypothetical protein [Streptomyces beijiangensis]
MPKLQQIKSLAGIWRIDQLIAEAPDDVWPRLSAGDGAKGPRVYDWASARLPVIDFFDGDEPTHRRWVLARRSIKRPDEIAYYLARAPIAATVAELVQIAGSRWAIEECFQAARTNAAWTSTKSAANRAGTATSPSRYSPRIPRRDGRRGHRKGDRRNDHCTLTSLTVTEIQKLLAACHPRPTPHQHGVVHALRWSRWRRHRQAVARHCHYRSRTRTPHESTDPAPARTPPHYTQNQAPDQQE